MSSAVPTQNFLGLALIASGIAGIRLSVAGSSLKVLATDVGVVNSAESSETSEDSYERPQETWIERYLKMWGSGNRRFLVEGSCLVNFGKDRQDDCINDLEWIFRSPIAPKLEEDLDFQEIIEV